ncbi:MAG TPA: FxLYD domain-containing protein [Candidatus Acidoferrum sp.]|nr:FxLYD domain-containing protein [Candidatus Acidoferrum sp.]
MQRVLRVAVGCGVVAMLMQACASGVTQSPSPGSAAQGAPSYGIYGVDSYFKVEWQADERGGKPMVSGYVANQWGLGARNVRLRVEALDAAGSVAATYIGYVNGYVTPGARVYFEVPVPAKAPSYRVTVLSFDPINGHN